MPTDTTKLIEELTKLEAEMTPGPLVAAPCRDPNHTEQSSCFAIRNSKGDSVEWRNENKRGFAALRNSIPALIAFAKRAEAIEVAAREVNEWYTRDGSVGGAFDPFEALAAALSPQTANAKGE